MRIDFFHEPHQKFDTIPIGWVRSEKLLNRRYSNYMHIFR